MANVQDPSCSHNSIPLAILTSSNQEKNACQESKNNSHGSPESVNLNSRTSSGFSSLMERDYIGLSDSSSPSSSIIAANSEGITASHNSSDCNDTELRLGFGPSPVVGNAKASGSDEAGEDSQSDITAAEISVERKLPTAQTMKEKNVQPQLKGVEIPRQDAPSTRQQHMQMFNGSSIDLRFAAPSTAIPFDTFNSAQKFWQAHMAAKAAEASEAGEAAGYWSTSAAGRFLVPVPKVSTVPAKRPYVDALRDNRDRTAIYNTNLQAVTAGSGWHMSTKETSSNGPFTNSVNLPPRSGVQFKVPAAVQNGETSNSSEATVSEVNGGMEDDNGRNKAPVVGWPPVRSFRRNTLAAAAQPKPEGGEDLRKEVSADGAAGRSEIMPTEQANNSGGGGAGGSLFVKAKLDGVRICRKVDLKSYDSYGSLKSALQHMFQGFVGGGGGDNMRLDLLHGNIYVLTHEDKEGDWMLVGDVPWNLFVTTVKSLRIMKSSDAIGQLGERVSARLREQSNC